MLYRVFAYLRHLFSAWNTRGEGIHSPYLFRIANDLMRDANRYYVWRDIEARREAMLHSPKPLHITDYGTGGCSTLLVSQVARHHLESAATGQLLFRLVIFLQHSLERPLNILELGTSLGITTAYLAAADSHNRVVTMEGSEETLSVARLNWEKLHLNNIQPVLGNIDDTLYNIRTHAHAFDSLDLIFMDANHTCEATIRYFEQILTLCHEQSIFVIDDIHHSPEMEQAWRSICQHERVSTTMDCFHFGLVFLDGHFIHRHYKIYYA